MKILFFDVRDEEEKILKQSCEYNNRNCGNGCECLLFPQRLDSQTLITEEMSNADIISCFTFSRVGADVLKNFPKLKLIALRSVGFNHIDIEYCKQNGISVVNSKGYGNVTVAEYAFALIFDVRRKVSRAYMNMKNEHLEKDSYQGYELFSSTIGLIGTGAIGAEAARIAHGIGMNILAYDIYPNEELTKKYGVKYVALDELLRNSDIVSLHSPLTKDNFHLINDEKLRLMKRSSIIVNTARGELIDTKALYDALAENRIFGAGLDVLEAENMLTQPQKQWDFDYLDSETVRQTLLNERLLKLRNVVVTPHVAFNTYEAQERILNITMNNINSFFNGEIKNSVF
ncbi:hydroxyacid dehydrogenase [bacterium]|nr:hydroxyacid dehydrogenase [bacterium]